MKRLGDEYFYGSQKCQCGHLVQNHGLRSPHRCPEPGCECPKKESR